MNENPTIATIWKGRILVGLEHEDSESPEAGVVPFNDAELMKKA